MQALQYANEGCNIRLWQTPNLGKYSTSSGSFVSSWKNLQETRIFPSRAILTAFGYSLSREPLIKKRRL